MTYKTCSKCELEKGTHFFNKNGRNGLYPSCNACRKLGRDTKKAQISAQHKRYYRKNKSAIYATVVSCQKRREAVVREFVTRLKQSPCTDCGGRFEPFLMEFDHREGTTKVSDVSQLLKNGPPMAKVLLEIGKTDLVCVMCHRDRTHTRSPALSRTSRRTLLHRDIRDRAKDKPCVDCGEKHSPWKMDFDHVRGTKVENVSTLVTDGTTEQLLQEIDKCDVVCARCHRIRTCSVTMKAAS